ncbi:MAG: 2-hydroxychromene-2-carboxylate isomerase [Rickettsiales bacterium]|nr:2-hydroxychromene-2-carboxylate isomerase [Rickettsiales bacterium]|tara:strand:+ start:1815 stop:2411 length:597 start_codon:yes stop_codon:yes gene_type:complete
MTKEVDYYYSHISPWSYLGAERFYKIAAASNAKINFKPVNLGVIFPQSGGLPLGKRAPQRLAYRMVELKRWAAHLGINLNFEPKYFPADDTTANLMAVSAGLNGYDVGPLSLVIMQKCWVEEKDVSEEAVLVEAANQCGFDGFALLEAARDDNANAGFKANTEEASKNGVFGAPTYIYKDEVFWGQDRLDFLECALDD